MDYKGGVILPRTERPIVALNNLHRLVVHFSAFLVDNTDQAYYFLHSEHWHECANTIVTTLHNLLVSLPHLSPDLQLGFDNHSTNLNNTFLAYLQWLCMTQVFNSIDGGATEAGHGKTHLDQAHSGVWQSYFSNQAYDVADLVGQCNNIQQHQGEWVGTFFNWKQWFAPYINNFPLISFCHRFHITADGVKSKQYSDDKEWGAWRTSCVEPHSMLKQIPPGYPVVFPPKQLTTTVCDNIKSALKFVPALKQSYLATVAAGKTGIPLMLEHATPYNFNTAAISPLVTTTSTTSLDAIDISTTTTEPLPSTNSNTSILAISDVAFSASTSTALTISTPTNSSDTSTALTIIPTFNIPQIASIVNRRHIPLAGIEDEAYEWNIILSTGAKQTIKRAVFRTSPENELLY